MEDPLPTGVLDSIADPREEPQPSIQVQLVLIAEDGEGSSTAQLITKQERSSSVGSFTSR